MSYKKQYNPVPSTPRAGGDSGKTTPRICHTKKQYNPVPSTPRAGGSLLRHDSAFSARNRHVTWPWSIGIGKTFFPADGHVAGVSCARFRKTSAGGRPNEGSTHGPWDRRIARSHSGRRARWLSRTAVARASRRECQSRGPAQQHYDANVAQAKTHVRL